MSTASIKDTLLQEVNVLSPAYYSEVLGFIETLKANVAKPEMDTPTTTNRKRPRSELRGWLKGKVWMADDFDAPLEEMQEYME